MGITENGDFSKKKEKNKRETRKREIKVVLGIY
jgi:hypothetical protein